MEKNGKICIINKILAEFFSSPQAPEIISAKDMMPLFIKKGVFTSDQREGLPIRQLLRELDERNMLSLIPYVLPQRKKKYTYWYFVACENPTPATNDGRSDTLISETKKNHRIDSDEYYVIELCNKVLNRVASQQHKFEFLRGDKGHMLPVDAYYEDLNLVIEYHEQQHTESVKLFDNKETVSGVYRGEQRRIYDERRKTVLPKHGIKLIVIDYSDFGTTRKLKRNASKDIDVVKKILSANGIVS